MDLYHAANYLDGINLVLEDAFVVKNGVTLLHDAAQRTSDGTYLIQTSFPIEELTTVCEHGVTVYSQSEDRAARITNMEARTVHLSEQDREHYRSLEPVSYLIPVDPYNSIDVAVRPAKE